VKPSTCYANSVPPSSLIKHWPRHLPIGTRLQSAWQNPNAAANGRLLNATVLQIRESPCWRGSEASPQAA
jgi:hypothetical protein